MTTALGVYTVTKQKFHSPNNGANLLSKERRVYMCTKVYCKLTNFGVLLYLANLANCVSSLIFVAAIIYVDRTLHRPAAGDAKFNSRQITAKSLYFEKHQIL